MQQQVEWLGKPCLLTSEQQKKGGSMGIWKGGREKKRGDIWRGGSTRLAEGQQTVRGERLLGCW